MAFSEVKQETSFVFVASCLSIIGAAILLGFLPLQEGNTDQFGWAVLLTRHFSAFASDWLAALLLLIIFSMATSATIISRTLHYHKPYVVNFLLLALCLTNPLILWSMTHSEAFAIPALSILMWSFCMDLQKSAFSKSAISVGVFLMLLLTSSSVFLWSALPLFAGLSLLISPRLLLKYRLVPLLIVLMPTVLTIIALLYWVWSSGTSLEGLQNFISPIEEDRIWQHRHGGQFASALGELLCWILLICPLVIYKLFSTTSVTERKICSVILMMPALSAALAIDFNALPSPLAFLTILATGQIWLTLRFEAGPALAGQYVSWLGSYLAIWYYGL
ncbi:MAG: hypothetical protein MRY72_12005 [Aquisalinus sp.]|nr:hypothetical protein [Aquisalinus sp.]